LRRQVRRERGRRVIMESKKTKSRECIMPGGDRKVRTSIATKRGLGAIKQYIPNE